MGVEAVKIPGMDRRDARPRLIEGDRPTWSLVDFKPLRSGTLRAHATVQMPSGMVVHDVPIFVGQKGVSAGTPSKPVIGPAGLAKRSPVPGKTIYVPTISWADNEIARRFSDAVVELVAAEHPDAIDMPRGAGNLAL